MNGRQRVLACLDHQPVDRVPRFEIWIDALLPELGQTDLQSAHANLGQDAILLPGKTPAGSNAWKTGVDEWGRVWQDGTYMSGVVDSDETLARYTPDLGEVEAYFDTPLACQTARRYPEHALFYGSHVGPFTSAYLAMGFERFFACLVENPRLACRLLQSRTDWCIALYQKAIELGAEVLVLGDDVCYQAGPMVSPAMCREFILPFHRQICEALAVPVIWHSDGFIEPLIPMAVEAGFRGLHGMEPGAGCELGRIKRQYGDVLVLVGNVDVKALCREDLGAVRAEVDRSLAQGGPTGYMLATCNSIFTGMNPEAAAEYFRYSRQRSGT